METFLELIENNIFKPSNYRRVKSNISNQERTSLRCKQKDISKRYYIQVAGSHFAVLDSDDYIEKFIVKSKEILLKS